MADGDAQDLAAGHEDGADLAGLAGDHLLLRHHDGIHQHHGAVDHPEGGQCALAGSLGQHFGPLLERRLLERIEDPSQLPVPPFQHPGQAVVALGEAAELVVAGQLQRRGQVAGGDLLHGPGDLPQRRAQVGGQQGGQQDREHDGHRHGEQQDPGEGRVLRGAPAGDHEDDDAEAGDGQDGGGHQPGRQACPEAGAGAPIGPSAARPGVTRPLSRPRLARFPLVRPGAGRHPPFAFAAPTSRYPMPRTVSRCTGRFGSTSTFWRRRRIVTHT